MTLEALYFIAQIVASLAIIASLVFVGMQIKAQTREQRLTRANESSDNYSRFQVLLIENPQFRKVWVKGADDISGLNPDELLGFGAYMALWVDSAILIQAQADNGFENAKTQWEQVGARYRPITRRKGAFQWWLRARKGYPHSIAPHIDQLFIEAGHQFPENITDK